MRAIDQSLKLLGAPIQEGSRLPVAGDQRSYSLYFRAAQSRELAAKLELGSSKVRRRLSQLLGRAWALLIGAERPMAVSFREKEAR